MTREKTAHLMIFFVCLSIMTDRMPEIGFWVNRNQPTNRFKASWIWLLFIFAIIDDLSKFCIAVWHALACSTLKNHLNIAKIWQKWRKSMFNLHWTHCSTALPKPQNPSFGYTPIRYYPSNLWMSTKIFYFFVLYRKLQIMSTWSWR